jgi:opacity protein-like surface antigen
MNKLLGLMFAALLLLPATADATKNSLGFAAGSTYGVGLSYALDFDSGHGLQITGLPYWSDEGGLIAAGANYRYTFHQNGRVGIYGSFGIAGMMSKDTYQDCDWNETTQIDNCTDVVEESFNLAAGPGVGLQAFFWDNMVVRFELPLTMRYGTDGFGITPIPNVALMYRWGD